MIETTSKRILNYALLWCITVSVSKSTNPLDRCPANLVRNEKLRIFKDVCYEFKTTEERRYNKAEKDCESRGGHMVIIRDFETQQFVTNILKELNCDDRIWIGLNDKKHEGTYNWVDGSPVSFTYWADGQPDGYDLEDCIVLAVPQAGHWRDNRCDTLLLIDGEFPYVCQYPVAAATKLIPINRPVLQAAVINPLDRCPSFLARNSQLKVFQDSCFEFKISHDREYDTAERDCESRGGHMVIIRDQATQTFVFNTLKSLNFGDKIWIGLNDETNEGDYVWVDGSHPVFTFWDEGQPGHIVNRFEDCVVMEMSSGGRWGDYRCTSLLFIHGSFPYICQYRLKALPTTHAVTNSPTTTTTTTLPTTSVKSTTSQNTVPQSLQNSNFPSSQNTIFLTSRKTIPQSVQSSTIAQKPESSIRQTSQNPIFQALKNTTFQSSQNPFRQSSENLISKNSQNPISQNSQNTMSPSLQNVVTQNSPTSNTGTSPNRPTPVISTSANMNTNAAVHGTSSPISSVSDALSFTTKQSKPPVMCMQCGDLITQIPCTEAELNKTEVTPCPMSDSVTYYCMSHMYHKSSNAPIEYYRSCGSTAQCQSDWYDPYIHGYNQFCFNLDKVVPDIMVCHICCHGNGCNDRAVPLNNTFFDETMP